MAKISFAEFRVIVTVDEAIEGLEDESGPLIDLCDTIENILHSINGPAIHPFTIRIEEC